MGISKHELKFYKNFEKMASDVISLAKAFFPDKMIYINYLSDEEQVTLKVSSHQTKINLFEGMTIKVNEGLCNTIDFTRNQPLIYEDIKNEKHLDDFKDILLKANINAYMGIPILLDTGERFGTLCSAHDEATHFDEKSIVMLEKLAQMFSYYLKLEHLAYKDHLTGVYNRQYLHKHFEDLKTYDGYILFFDLDRFKQVNDTLGHETGDLVLKEMANKLEEFTYPYQDAFVCRLGGDEFLVILPEIDTQYHIVELANTLHRELSDWNTPIGNIQLSSSIGILHYFKDEKQSLRDLLEKADKALYDAKSNGKNRFTLYQ